MNIVSSLRKCCNHPYLFDGIEPEPFEEGKFVLSDFRVFHEILLESGPCTCGYRRPPLASFREICDLGQSLEELEAARPESSHFQHQRSEFGHPPRLPHLQKPRVCRSSLFLFLGFVRQI